MYGSNKLGIIHIKEYQMTNLWKKTLRAAVTEKTVTLLGSICFRTAVICCSCSCSNM